MATPLEGLQANTEYRRQHCPGYTEKRSAICGVCAPIVWLGLFFTPVAVWAKVPQAVPWISPWIASWAAGTTKDPAAYSNDFNGYRSGPHKFSRNLLYLVWQTDRHKKPSTRNTLVQFEANSERDAESHGVQIRPNPGRSLDDGKRAFLNKNYALASEIMIENRYTKEALQDPYYLNWLLKALLAAGRLARIPDYLRQYRMQPDFLRKSTDARDAELYYLIGRYYFALGDMQKARSIFIDYLQQFPGSQYVPQSYYWIGRSLEQEGYLEEARPLYLLVAGYFSQHYLNDLAKYKVGEISLSLLKKQAEDFLRSQNVE